MSAHESPGSFTTRCFRASTDCCCDSRRLSYLLPDRPAEAKEKLDGAIEHAAKAITEGRDAVQGLRTSAVERNDLAVAIRTLGDELATEASAHQPSTFRVAVEGQARDCTQSFVTRSTR